MALFMSNFIKVLLDLISVGKLVLPKTFYKKLKGAIYEIFINLVRHSSGIHTMYLNVDPWDLAVSQNLGIPGIPRIRVSAREPSVTGSPGN